MEMSPEIENIANWSKIILLTNFDIRNRFEMVSECSDFSFLIIGSLDEKSPNIENVTFPGQRRVQSASTLSPYPFSIRHPPEFELDKITLGMGSKKFSLVGVNIHYQVSLNAFYRLT